MKRTLLFAFFIILAASLIALAIIYRVHWILLVLLAVFFSIIRCIHISWHEVTRIV